MTSPTAFIGVDVGTGSARAGVFSAGGELLATARRPIALMTEGAHVEQSSADVWQAVCGAVHEARAAAGLPPEAVAGLAFDATCSMVVMGEDGGLPVGDPARPAQDIIVWMDHRALGQAERINAGRHAVLDYVGGTISPEMQTPKLLWLKENRPAVFAAARHFFDLADYLGWRATGATERSSCTVTCKWTYLALHARDRSICR